MTTSVHTPILDGNLHLDILYSHISYIISCLVLSIAAFESIVPEHNESVKMKFLVYNGYCPKTKNLNKIIFFI